jgi:uncharacterized membrane protein YjjP (DUF1212 family)
MLYLSSSSFIIMLAAAAFGQVSGSWAIANTAGLAATGAFLMLCRYKRRARAKQFYVEWLSTLSTTEFAQLHHRLKPQSIEKHIVSERLMLMAHR